MNVSMFFLALVTFVSVFTCRAGDTLETKVPKVILVQLRSEARKINALTARKNYKLAEQMKTDALGVSTAFINDFKDNFSFCPVYYYMDTNAGFVQKKQFAGVLLQADGASVVDAPLDANSTDYLIVYYGSPVSQSKREKVVDKDDDRNVYDAQAPMGKGLVILDCDYKQVDYYYKLGYDDLLIKTKDKHKKYMYTSKRFDMEYFPFAATFQKKLATGKGKRHKIIIPE